MYTEHEVARKRQLLGGSNEVDVETDEQLARRLHEELNALTRHSRRAAAAPSGPSTQQKTGKPVSAQNDKQTAKQHRGSDAAKQPSLAAVKQEAVGVREQQTGSDREEKGRKRCMLNRELAMLVVDMVESQVKPVNGPRSKLKGEQQQENHNAAVKHESSSSLSEQERLAIEHLHAAGADGKLVNKLLLGSHLLARTSDSGAAADSSTTGATSSGKSSGLEQEQQQSSGQQQQQAQQQLQRVNTVNSSAAASTRAAAASTADCGGSRPVRIPKLPMVQYGKEWYRAKVLKDAGSKVMLEYQGYNHEGGPFWLNKDHARIWRGSYKGKDWRYLGDGAWEPKVAMTQEPKARSRCRIQRKHSTATGTASDATAPEDSDAEEEEDEEEEELQQQQQQRQQRRQPCRGRAAVKSTAPAGDAVGDNPGHSGHDTSSTDQEGEGDAGSLEQQQRQQQEPGHKKQAAEVLTVDSPAVPENVLQHGLAVAIKTVLGEQSPQPYADLEQQHEQLFEQQQQLEGEQEQGREVVEAMSDGAQEVMKLGVTKHVLPYVHQEQQDSEQQQQLDAEHQQQADVKHNKSQQRADSKGKLAGRQPQQDKQQSQSDPKQSESKQQTSRRRRQSEADANDAGGQKAAALDSPLVKQSRRQASARAAEKAAERAAAAATAERLAAAEKEAAAAAAAKAAAAAAAPAPAADSSSERQAGDAAPPSKAGQTEAKDEVLSARTKSTGRGGRTRGGRHNSKSTPSAAATAETPVSTKRARGGRNKPGVAAAAPTTGAASDVSGKEQQPQLQAQASVSNAALQVDAGRALKHSSSSEGMPLSPTSPTAGGSPRMTGHRRKGKPQRARLDSDDLQQPAKKIKVGSTTNKSNGLAWAYSNSDAADILEMSFEQAPPPQPKSEPEPQQQQQQQAQEQQQVHLGWKGGWKGAYKKGIWQQQQGKEVKQRDHAQSLYHKQQHEVMVVQQPWCEQQELHEIHPGAAPVAVGEDSVPAEQQQQQQQSVLGGSDPDDVEAACVLVGASVGRTHSTEVYNTFDMQQQTYQQHQHAYMSDEQPLSPRAYQAAAAAQANNRQNGRRRGHNWSKPLSRPPRPPTLHQPQQQQHGFVAARRHSSNGSLQHGMYASGDLCNQQAQGVVQEALYTAAVAPSPRFSRQSSLQGCNGGVLPQIPAGLHGQQQQLQREGSYQLCNGEANGKPATLRALLDAVGEVQANSGRPDLMYPLQYGGLPTTSDVAKPAGLHLPHVQVSAAAAALLAAVPSLETLQHMASARGQAGPLVACLSGDSSLSLFH